MSCTFHGYEFHSLLHQSQFLSCVFILSLLPHSIAFFLTFTNMLTPPHSLPPTTSNRLPCHSTSSRERVTIGTGPPTPNPKPHATPFIETSPPKPCGMKDRWVT